MRNNLESVRYINLKHEFAENGDLTVIEGMIDLPFQIARVFVVRGLLNSTRGRHAHKECVQFLTCPYGAVEVICEDGNGVSHFILDRPDMGLLIPSGIWAQQNYLVDNSVLTVFCDKSYDSFDYIRNYEEYLAYRKFD
jgi:dTDP-4-dehydrorhamnose 3,5-epimerase-like enzyme